MFRQIILCPLIVSLLFTAGCAIPTANVAEHAADAMETGLMSATQYYVSDGGYLVPLTRKIPIGSDFAESSLRLIVSGAENDAMLDLYGLKAPLPAGVEVFLADSGGHAAVEIAGLEAFPDRETEQHAVDSIVNTALALPGVSGLSLTFDGKALETLSFGTSVSGEILGKPLNQEPLPVSAGTEPPAALVLYYPLASQDLLVPVTRYISGKLTAARAVEELIKGPASEGLNKPFSSDMLLISISSKKGVATLNFNAAIQRISDAQMKTAACMALYHTLRPFMAINQLVILSEGAPYFEYLPQVLNEMGERCMNPS